MDIFLDPNETGEGNWVISHPTIGTLYHIAIIADNEDMAIELTDLRNERVIDVDSWMIADLAPMPPTPTESIEEMAFRQLIETTAFDDLEPDDREFFLLGVAKLCITWVTDRNDF